METGDGINASRWRFRGEAVERFENHIQRSIPGYQEGHRLVVKLSDFFVQDQSICYELGCATGSLTHQLAKHHQDDTQARFVGIDLESEMIEWANNHFQSENLSYLCDDILQAELQSSDLIVCYYTLQFVRPSQRQQMFDRIFQTLRWGGALILFEKVRANDARFQDIMTTLYLDYKLEQGYQPSEVLGKMRSLKGVLEPFSTQGNLDLMKRAGFVDIMSVWKHLCFEGFLAIK